MICHRNPAWHGWRHEGLSRTPQAYPTDLRRDHPFGGQYMGVFHILEDFPETRCPSPKRVKARSNSGRSRDLHHCNPGRRNRCWVLRIELSTLDPRGSAGCPNVLDFLARCPSPEGSRIAARADQEEEVPGAQNRTEHPGSPRIAQVVRTSRPYGRP